MSYLAARMMKMKSENLNGIGRHNDRLTEKHSNPDIDSGRSHLNYDLIQREGTIKADVEEYINKNKKTTRATRKDAVLVNEWIVTSDRDFFKNLSKERTREFFEISTRYFQSRFGKENVRYAVVHLDETTPHMHIGIVPFDKDKKLSAKRVFDRKALLEVQNDLPSVLGSEGFDIQRGERGSERVHLDTPEYKATVEEIKFLRDIQSTVHAQVKDLDEKKKKLQNEKDSLEDDVTRLRSLKTDTKEYHSVVKEIEEESTPLFGKIVLSKNIFEKAFSLLKKAAAVIFNLENSLKVKNLENTRLRKNISTLEKQFDNMERQRDHFRDQSRKLELENRDISKEVVKEKRIRMIFADVINRIPNGKELVYKRIAELEESKKPKIEKKQPQKPKKTRSHDDWER